jgi:ADP-ribosyl-[dinitrogen reductase] hydrolase
MASDPCYRICGCAVGAAVGDALGMPLEFGPPQPVGALVREMRRGPLPAGSFTDDTEMALALAESLLAHKPLDPVDLAQRFVAWYRSEPSDVGIHTRDVLHRIARGEPWEWAVLAVQQKDQDSAGNGSLMRCWPAALAQWRDLDRLLYDSRLQSRVTHPHPDCVAACAFVNTVIHFLLHGEPRKKAVALALDAAEVPADLRRCIEEAPVRQRDELKNSGWARHTVESAVWALLSTDSFEEALVRAVNLGCDADTTGAVVGALAGAAYGLEAIPLRWREAVRGEWPLCSGRILHVAELIDLANQLGD